MYVYIYMSMYLCMYTYYVRCTVCVYVYVRVGDISGFFVKTIKPGLLDVLGFYPVFSLIN